jgi:two-component system NtrC family sensor kinase
MSTDDFFDGLDGLETIGKTQTDRDKNQGPTWNEWFRLTRIVQDLTTNLDVDSLLDSVMDYAIEITKAERGFLVLVNDSGDLDFQVARGMDRQEIVNAEKAASRSVIQKVIENRRPILENDVPSSDDLARKHSLMQLEIKSVMGAPMISKDKLIGVAYVDTRSITNLFSREDLTNLETFVNLAAIAIENARLFQNLTQTTQNYKILKEYHENILKSLPMGVVVVESDRTVEYLSEHALGIWSLKPGEGVGKKFELLFPKKGGVRDEALELWERYQKGAKEVEGEITTGNKTYRVSFFDVLRWGRQDVRSGMLLVDITFRKQLEAELVNAEKRATVIQLAGGIAHEVNNLLTPILGRTAIVQMRLERGEDDLTEGVNNDIKIIDHQAQRIQKVVEDLNRLSRPSKPEMVATCVGKCLSTAVDLLSSTAGRIKKFSTDDPSADFYLSLKIEDNLPLIFGDPQSIEQMFINLIINSAHAVEDKGKGKIILQVEKKEDRVVATFEDTGIGITDEILQHIFEPYFTTKDSNRGTGLGMPIVRQIAEMHKAKVDLDTEEAVGTTITISFPVPTKKMK